MSPELIEDDQNRNFAQEMKKQRRPAITTLGRDLQPGDVVKAVAFFG